MELSRNIKRAADRYEPVETAGLTLWPIRVCEQEDFERARPAIDVIQQALPVRYAVMPLLKLKRRQEAIQRAADYLICGISEGGGTKWKGGNPVPHLFYDREREEAGAMTPLSQFTNNTEH